ncbi:IclR family transcriptional regulator domain-containing protein [Tatumella terrea]|uniref:IclR-ED domain-containing protein n=1 Tax=Tatumella terrea TaxID=419007 RepID=A0ABW1VXC9_9GAMM
MFKSGPESLFYSTQYLNRLNIRRVALPFMIEIQKLLTEKQAVISLSIPVRDHVVLIERIWTQLTPLNVLMDLSDQYLIDKIPSGLAILATYTEENCRMLLDAERYAAVEPRLRQICDSQGFCIGVNEQKIGLNSIAYPIFNGRDEGSGALVIAGLDAEDELALDSMLAGHLKRACENISGQLNYL